MEKDEFIALVAERYGVAPDYPWDDFDNAVFRHKDSRKWFALIKACDYMEKNYIEHIYLDQICHYAGLSKSTLLRAFTKSKGVTPYRYLENIRIGRAKKLLENGFSPMETALETGFSDQSHFTNYFNRYFGLTPAAYRKIFQDNTSEDAKE